MAEENILEQGLDAKAIKAERKRLKAEQKAQKKEAKKLFYFHFVYFFS